MEHKTDTDAGRAAFIRWHMDCLLTDEMLAAYVWNNDHSVAAAFKAGRASLAATAGSEPVATIKSWTNGSYWRNYNVVFHRDDLPVGTDLFTRPSPPEGMVMVPREPTEAMKSAAVKYANGSAVYKNVKAEVLRIEEGIYGEVYEAMIAAAPPIAAGGGKDASHGK